MNCDDMKHALQSAIGTGLLILADRNEPCKLEICAATEFYYGLNMHGIRDLWLSFSSYMQLCDKHFVSNGNKCLFINDIQGIQSYMTFVRHDTART